MVSPGKLKHNQIIYSTLLKQHTIHINPPLSSIMCKCSRLFRIASPLQQYIIYLYNIKQIPNILLYNSMHKYIYNTSEIYTFIHIKLYLLCIYYMSTIYQFYIYYIFMKYLLWMYYIFIVQLCYDNYVYIHFPHPPPYN